MEQSMKKHYTEEDMLRVIQEVEAEFSQALAKAEAEVKQEEAASENTENVEADFEQEIEELYSSMEKSEAETHLKALSKVLGVSEMKKSEESEETKLLKSELEAVKASNEELKKNLEKAIEIITKSVKPAAPQRKAITSEVDFIKKSENENTAQEKDFTKLSKSEIKSALSEKIRSGKLEKKDKEAIVSFYEGKTNIESIKHLL
jgi:hypothetical protein